MLPRISETQATDVCSKQITGTPRHLSCLCWLPLLPNCHCCSCNRYCCAAAGDSSSLVGLLQRSTTAAERMQALECLQRDTAVTRARLGGDAGSLAALEEWVLDLMQDRMSFHVLETLLKVQAYPLKVLSHSCNVL